MIDSRNSSARGKRSHIAGIDTSSFGYRPATEGTFFCCLQTILVAGLQGILLSSIPNCIPSPCIPSPSLFLSPLTHCSGACRTASLCSLVKRCVSGQKAMAKKVGIDPKLWRDGRKKQMIDAIKSFLQKMRKRDFFDFLSASNLTGAWYGSKSDTHRLKDGGALLNDRRASG